MKSIKWKLPLVAVFALALIAMAAVYVSAPRVRRALRGEAAVTIVGDVMLARGVGEAMEAYGEAYPFEDAKSLFLADDLTFANLECALTEQDATHPNRITLKAPPGRALSLKGAGLDLLSLANNHALDCGPQGLSDTISALESAGLSHVGTAKAGAAVPRFIEINGVKLGFLAYSCFEDGYDSVLALMSAGRTAELCLDIRQAVEQCDFLTVAFHWGAEYRHYTTPLQRALAHAAAESGASLVIGAHPHVLQGVEQYRGVPIYYSLGNFVFDAQRHKETSETIALRVTVSQNGIAEIQEIPFRIENCRPVLDLSGSIPEKLALYSGRIPNE